MSRSRRQFLEAAARIGSGAAVASVVGSEGCVRHIAAPAGRALPAAAVDVSGAGSLGAHAAAHGVLYGCAVDVAALRADAMYAKLIREQCRIVVAENAMKWPALRPSPTTFRFDEADVLIAFAEANHLKVRGHNLVWHRDNPAWFGDGLTSNNARTMLLTHIETVMGRYAGRMHSWDVVNEAIEVSDGRPDGLRASPWLRLVGDDYIELAFRTARDADPQALLTYNEYGLEPETPDAETKRQSVLELLRRMVARRVPVDALGVQSHLSALAPSPNETRPGYGAGLLRFLAGVREIGLQVFVIEMDGNDRAVPLDLPSRDSEVAASYRRYLDVVLAEPAVRVVMTWGITDRYTWLNHEQSRDDKQPERPLPFDSDGRATPAFFALRDAFDRRSRTLR